jgi:hypothetical protein
VEILLKKSLDGDRSLSEPEKDDCVAWFGNYVSTDIVECTVIVIP